MNIHDGFLKIYVTFKYGDFGYLSDFFGGKHLGFSSELRISLKASAYPVFN